MPLDNKEPDKPELSPVGKQVKNDSQQFAMAMELPFVIVAAIGVGGLMGYGLDYWLHTKPIFMMIFGGLGFAVGIRDVLRRMADK
jgi:ATP synthase protein I